MIFNNLGYIKLISVEDGKFGELWKYMKEKNNY